MNKEMSSNSMVMVEVGNNMKSIVAVVLFLALILILMLINRGSESSSPSTLVNSKSQHIDIISNAAGIMFPPDSSVVYFLQPDRLVDPIWLAKVSLPEASYSEFRQELLLKEEDHTRVSGSLVSSIGWWHPQEILDERQYLADEHTLVTVIVSKEGEGIYIYLECITF